MQSNEIMRDLHDLGFKFRTVDDKSRVEILYRDRWWRLYNRQDRMMIMAIVRTELRDLGYTESDVRAATDVVRAGGV